MYMVILPLVHVVPFLVQFHPKVHQHQRLEEQVSLELAC